MEDKKGNNTATRTIILTGGGTAGHVTPNLALLPHLRDAGYDIHYIGSEDGIEKTLLSSYDYVTYHSIPSGKLRRYFSLKNFTDPFRVLLGISRAKKIIKKLRPKLVFSKGGFVSVPVVLGAKRIAPVISHESDYTPGLANRISSRYAKKVCVTFEDTMQFVGEKAVYTGTPIRDELFAGDADKGFKFLGLSGKKPVLLVMGGSLGAEAVNRALREALPELLTRFDIAHICGAGKVDPSAIVPGYVQFEYIKEELADVFAAASIMLSRAGANAVFEILALMKPALLVPLPSKSSRGDQLLNAEYFKKRGFSKVLLQEDITPELLTEQLFELYSEREKYSDRMAQESAREGTKNVLNVIFETLDAEK